jgi:hypothetical protein
VTGAQPEAGLADALSAQIGSAAVTAAGKLTFRETIALLPFVRACVTGDTAIMHAAAALGRKVYALFGPTSPVETGPYGEGHYVFCGRCPSRPCFCFECKSKLCMKSIVPAEVHAVMTRHVAGHSTCDIYKTAFNPDSTLRLEPIMVHGQPYFNEIGSGLTLKFVEPDFNPAIRAGGETSPDIKHESLVVVHALDRMAQALSAYIENRSPGAIGQFEGFRRDVGSLKGIGTFWTAMLNLRLNSIPLIDPVAGVRESLRACLATRDSIQSALSSLQ